MNGVLLLNLSKLRSKLILIKNDKRSIEQTLQQQNRNFILFQNECLHQTSAYSQQLKDLQVALEEANDTKNLLESQSLQLREERDEMGAELQTLRRPENEIIKELEEQLANIQKQTDIDMQYVHNANQEIDDKQR